MARTVTIDAGCNPASDSERLHAFIRRYPRLTLLTGAGCSSASGIPHYRDDDGNWMHQQPMQFADFAGHARHRRRYWARSFVGWQRIEQAQPNPAHRAIAALEQSGHVDSVITQNVDDLHRVAGSRRVIDLHGVLRRIRCLDCGETAPRAAFQERLRACNPGWQATTAAARPDGDSSLSAADIDRFRVPGCDRCGGTVKPDVVFFGEAVPATRVEQAGQSLDRSDALLVVGSSLMVFSGYRFARLANDAGKPVAIVNRGVTRADDIATHKLTGDLGEVLSATVARLGT